MFGQITELRFFEKINFLCFEGPQKTFLSPKTLFGLRNPTFGGVILLKLFDPSYDFEVIDFEIAIFWLNKH